MTFDMKMNKKDGKLMGSMAILLILSFSMVASILLATVPSVPKAHATGLAVDGSQTCITLCVITTSSTEDVIIVYADNWDVSNITLMSISDNASLIWHYRAASHTMYSGVYVDTEEWWAVAPSPLTNDNISLNWSSTPSVSDGVAFGISGADTIVPFDNGTVPVTVDAGPSFGDGAYPFISTNNPNDMIIGVVNNFNGYSCPCANTTAGFTGILDTAYISSEEQIVSMTVSSFEVSFNMAGSDTEGAIADAVQIAGSSPSPPELVQKTSSSTCTVNLVCHLSFLDDVTTGDLIVATVAWSDPGTIISSTFTVTDSLGSVWGAVYAANLEPGSSVSGIVQTDCKSQIIGYGGVYACLLFAVTTSSGADTVTVPTINSGAGSIGLQVTVSEYNGVSKLQTNRILQTNCYGSCGTSIHINKSPGVSPLCFGLPCSPYFSSWNTNWLVLTYTATQTGNEITSGTSGFSHVSGCGNNETICQQYLSASTGGNSSYPMTASSTCSDSSGCWNELVVMFTAPVTVQLAFDSQGSPSPPTTTFYLGSGPVNGSGNFYGLCGGVPVTGMSGGGSTDDVSMAANCETSVKPNPGSWSFAFASVNGSTWFTSCASGICSGIHTFDYWAFNDDFAIVLTPVSPSTWDGIYMIRLNFTISTVSGHSTQTTASGHGSYIVGVVANYGSYIVFPSSFASDVSGNWVSNGSVGPILDPSFFEHPADYSIGGGVTNTLTLHADSAGSVAISGSNCYPIIYISASALANTDACGTTTTITADSSTTIKIAGLTTYAAGLVGYWPFDEGTGSSVYDYASSNTGTLQNSPTWESSGCVYGDCLSFSSGSNQYVSVPDSSSLHITTAVTMCAWVDPATLSGTMSVIVNDLNSGGSEGYSLALNSSSIQVVVDNTVLTAGYTTPTSQWTLVCGTWSGSVITAYVNGVSEGTTTASGTATNSGLALNIGKYTGVTGQNWNGRLDDVRVYNTALSGTNVLNMYQEIWVMQASGAAQSFSTGSGGTSVTYYYYNELGQTTSYSVVGGGSPTAPDITYNTAPASSGSSDSPQTLTPTLVAYPTTQTIYPDKGTSATVPSSISGASNERWTTPTSSFTISAAETVSDPIPYTHQYYVTVTPIVASGGAVLNSSNEIKFVYSNDGAFTTSSAVYASSSIWADSNTNISPVALSSGSTTDEVWCGTQVCSGLVGYWPLQDGVATSTSLAYDLSGKGNSAPLTGGGSGSPMGIIIPLYIAPGAAWNAVIAEHEAYPSVPMIVIINPDSGPGTYSSTYNTYINSMRAAGITVIGYVYTDYGARSSATVETDIASYKSYYTLDGIFFDQMANTAGEASYYTTLQAYVVSESFANSITVGNPGTSIPSALEGIFTNVVIDENSGLPSTATLSTSTSGYPTSNFSFIAYGVSLSSLTASYVTQVRNYVSYMYVTDATLPNPYDVLPSYFATEMSYAALTGSSQFTSGSTCIFGGTCINFVSGQYLEAGVSGHPTSAMTLSAWVKTSGLPGSGSYEQILGYNAASGRVLIGHSGAVTFELTTSTTSYTLNTATLLTANKWYLVTATWSGTTMEVFINGVKDANTQATTGTLTFTASHIYIGIDSTTTNYPYSGLMSDARVYNVALSAALIRELYVSVVPSIMVPVIAPAQAITLTYHDQLSTAFAYRVNSGSPTVGPALSFKNFANSETYTATMSNASIWLDRASTWKYPTIISSDGQSWIASVHITGLAYVDGDPLYILQISLTVSYSLIGGGLFNDPILTYIHNGQTIQVNVTGTPETYIGDNNTMWSITNPLIPNNVSAINTLTERALTNGTTSGTFLTDPTMVLTYYHQFLVPFQFIVTPSGTTYSGHPTFSYVQNGTRLTGQTLYSTPHAIWTDAGTTWTAENPWTDSPDGPFTPQTKGGIVLVSGSIGNTNAVTIYYSKSAACSGTDTLTLAEQGCYAGAIFFTYGNLLGDWFVALLLCVLCLGIYMKTENGTLAVFCFFIGSLVLGVILPPAFGGLIAFGIAALITYFVFEFVRSRND